MPEKSKQNEGIESGRNAEEPETKGRDLNLGAMPENSKQNEGIKSGCDVGEHKTKRRD